jgi:ATP-dependent DNA helicase RecQ
MMLKVLDVDGAVRRVSGGWTGTGQAWAYDAERYTRVSAERHREQQAMLGYIATAGCRMDYLRRELDDPDTRPCGRCDNCTGTYWPAEVPEAAASAARDRLLRPGTELEPRKMWPSGMRELGIGVSGKIGADLVAEPGRALGKLTDLGWGPRLRAILDPAVPDEAVPEDAVAAVVTVLAAWPWAQRPAGVVSIPSATRPLLVSSLAARIAQIGRMPYLGALERAPGLAGPDGQDTTARQHNSAQRLRAVWDSFTVPDPVRDQCAELTGPVLLVDDLLDTGWTMTVAAMILRQAGAPAVLPFTLATAAA